MSQLNYVKDEDLIRVENIADMQIGYVLASNGKTQRFMPHVSRMIPAGELRELSYQNGGLYLLQNYLRVCDKTLAEEFGVTDDSFSHEYAWNDQDIDRCLKSDDINVLLDALDFAPQGIVDSLRQRAIELEIPDTRKLKAIGDKTGIDMQAVIRNKHAYDGADDGSQETKNKRRRVDATKKTAAPRRRRAS